MRSDCPPPPKKIKIQIAESENKVGKCIYVEYMSIFFVE